MRKRYEIDMCNGPLLKSMLLFAIPLMCSSMLQLLFNAADLIVISNFRGEDSMSAVGSNTALINLLTNLFVGLSVGVNVLVARYYGARKEKELKASVHTAISLSIVSGIMLMVIGIIFARDFLILMRVPKRVLPLATTYLRIYFIGMPAMMVYNFGSSVLRAVGDTKRPLYYLTVAGVVNVIVNLLLVVGAGRDVEGVAVATVFSQIISAVLILRALIKEESTIKLSIKQLRIEKNTLSNIFKIGIPAGIQGVIFALSNVLIQSSINSFGEITLAGNAAAANIESFVYMGMNAFHQAAVSFTGQNVGAGKKERIGKILITAQGCVIAVGLIMGIGALLFGNPLLRIYSSDTLVIAAGMRRLYIISATYALCGIMDVFVGVLRGMGYSVMPMIVSLVGACGLRILWLATVFKIPEYHTIEVVYLSYPITWLITLCVHFICYIVVKKKMDGGRNLYG